MGRKWAKEPGAEFTAQAYREVAAEHITALSAMYKAGLYTLTMYVSGLAVEAMFRAYRTRFDPQFDSRHDLYELERASKFADKVPPTQVRAYSDAFSVVAITWSNSHRYRSNPAMRAYLRRLKLNRGMKGDFVKENARRMISAATEVVTMGTALWTS